MTQSALITELACGIGRSDWSSTSTGIPTTPTIPATATLFLDFDGVLHPEYCQPSRFFESLPLLAMVLQDRPWVELVVSSNWRYERVDGSMSGSSTGTSTEFPTEWRLKPWEVVLDWLQSEPVVAQRVVGINPLMPDRSQLPDRVLAYEREAQCLAWLRAWRPSRIHWLALDDRSWLFSPFCPQLFQTDGTRGLLAEQLGDLCDRLDGMRG